MHTGKSNASCPTCENSPAGAAPEPETGQEFGIGFMVHLCRFCQGRMFFFSAVNHEMNACEVKVKSEPRIVSDRQAKRVFESAL